MSLMHRYQAPDQHQKDEYEVSPMHRYQAPDQHQKTNMECPSCIGINQHLKDEYEGSHEKTSSVAQNSVIIVRHTVHIEFDIHNHQRVAIFLQ